MKSTFTVHNFALNYITIGITICAISFMIGIEAIDYLQLTFAQSEISSNSVNIADLGFINGQNTSYPFYTENTKSTNTKVSSIDPIPTVEVTYAGNSTIGGSPTQTIGTVTDKMNNDGSVSSNGQAIILTSSGQVITYRTESIGNYNPDGSFSDSGIMVFHTPFKMNLANSAEVSSNLTNSLPEQFDNVFGIYKKTVDPEGNGFTKVWKWN